MNFKKLIKITQLKSNNTFPQKKKVTTLNTQNTFRDLNDYTLFFFNMCTNEFVCCVLM